MDDTSIHVERAVDGDPSSVEWVVSHFYPLVEAQIRFRLAGRGSPEAVEDLVADVWLATLPKLHNLEPRQGRYAPVLARFLGTTAIQLCNNFLRRKIRRGLHGAADEGKGGAAEMLDAVAEQTRGVVTRAAQLEMRQAVAYRLDSLSEDKRNILVLRLLEQRSNQEIAETLGLKSNTVAVRYRRALEELRASLPRDVFEEIRALRG